MYHFFLVLVALILVLMNAFFVAAEFGMVKLRHTRIQLLKENYGLRGRMLWHVHQHLDAYLSACQLGITLTSLGLGWVGEPAFAHLFRPIFSLFNVVSENLLVVTSYAAAFITISFLHIVVGELMPKSLAIRQSESISLWTATPLYGFYWLMYPAIWLLNSCANFLLRILRLDTVHQGERFYSTDEIKLILTASHAHGELTQEEAEMIEHTLDFADLDVTELMRPREEMISLDLAQSKEALMETVLKYRFSRYPVYDKDPNHILGVIHVKDLFSTLKQKDLTYLRTLIRPILKVPAHLPALGLLKQFREGMPHFALVYNRREILIGFVTLDNLLHVLIGKIKDEFHRTKDDWSLNTDGSLTVRGDCSLYALEQAIDREIKVSETEAEINTVAGLIIARLGRLPQIGERFSWPEFSAMIESVEGARIRKLRIFPCKLGED